MDNSGKTTENKTYEDYKNDVRVLSEEEIVRQAQLLNICLPKYEIDDSVFVTINKHSNPHNSLHGTFAAIIDQVIPVEEVGYAYRVHLNFGVPWHRLILESKIRERQPDYKGYHIENQVVPGTPVWMSFSAKQVLFSGQVVEEIPRSHVVFPCRAKFVVQVDCDYATHEVPVRWMRLRDPQDHRMWIEDDKEKELFVGSPVYCQISEDDINLALADDAKEAASYLGRWLAAIITNINGIGDEEDAEKLKLYSVKILSAPLATTFVTEDRLIERSPEYLCDEFIPPKLGEVVLASENGQDDMKAGTVIKIHDNFTYDVQFRDIDKIVEEVPSKWMRFPKYSVSEKYEKYLVSHPIPVDAKVCTCVSDFKMEQYITQILLEKCGYFYLPKEPHTCSFSCTNWPYNLSWRPQGGRIVDFTHNSDYSKICCSFENGAEKWLSDKAILAKMAAGLGITPITFIFKGYNYYLPQDWDHLDDSSSETDDKESTSDDISKLSAEELEKYQQERQRLEEERVDKLKRNFKKAIENIPSVGYDCNVWFCKPCERDYGGGMILAESLHACAFHEDRIPTETYVIQPHIDQTLLLKNGRKLGIRIYLLMVYTKNDNFLKAYMHESGGYMALGSDDTWSSNSLDKNLQLTHTTRMYEGVEGLRNWSPFSKIFPVIQGDMQKLLHERIFANIETNTLCKNHCECAYELMGLDYVMDKNLKPWLLEANSGPILKEGQRSILLDLVELVFNKNPKTGWRNIAEMQT